MEVVGHIGIGRRNTRHPSVIIHRTLVQPVALTLFEERFPADAEDTCRGTLSAPCEVQHLCDIVAFQFLQRSLGPQPGGVWLGDMFGQLLRTNLCFVTTQSEMLNERP